MSARGRAVLLLYATVQFHVLTLVGMVTYPGGTLFDATTTHYRFFDNFFSDLGTTRAYSGQSNMVSCVLFVIALGTVGAAMVAFSGAWRSFAFERGLGRSVGLASQGFGTASGVAFAGIAVTPWNLVLPIHLVFVLAAFSLLVGYVACLTLLMHKNGDARAQVRANVAYLVVLLGYVGLLLFGPDLRTETGHRVHVTAQKIIVYVSMINLTFQALAVRRRLARSSS